MPQPKLNRLLEDFRRLLRQTRSSVPVAGLELQQELFRNLPQEAKSARHWLLVLDGALLESPVAALPANAAGTRFLIEDHSLAVVTGATALAPEPGPKPGEVEQAMFLGIGDAIYNTADARWQASSAADGVANKGKRNGWSFLTSAAAAGKGSAAAGQLPRLAGSRIELESCARNWKGPSLLLTGREANRQTAIRAIENGAQVLHFSTHFIEKDGAPDEALLLLGLDAQGRAELLSTSDAVHIKVQNSLVVLSGCHSSAGAVYPGVGLVGMTRAWLMAGAQGVVASLWPTPDDSGEIFQSFYRELQKGSLLDRGAAKEAAGKHRGQFLRKAAEALRNAQLEMLRTRTWRALPKYWGTYQLTARAI
jgi:CHAT domain-containing protein